MSDVRVRAIVCADAPSLRHRGVSRRGLRPGGPRRAPRAALGCAVIELGGLPATIEGTTAGGAAGTAQRR
jgi:hypothetical protein